MTTIPATMRAVVLDAPGPPDALRIRELPVPTPRAGEVPIKVEAFGLNRSELHTRLGLADGVTFPRVLGIEATGTVAACPGAEYAVGQQVAALMGGMGRTYDGGCAEYTRVPTRQVVPFTSDLDCATLGAAPEMLQTSHSSLTIGLDARAGQTILIRGGTSSIGMATAVLAKRLGMTVLSTTRSPDRADTLHDIGVDHVLIDDGNVADQARRRCPVGVDTALELIGTPTLPDTLRATRIHGVVCFTGMLSNQWTVRDFYPIDYLPRGLRLTAYGSDATDLPAAVLQDFLDAVAAGDAIVPIHRKISAPVSSLREEVEHDACCRSDGLPSRPWATGSGLASSTARRLITALRPRKPCGIAAVLAAPSHSPVREKPL
jgi:NADPH:quinone reductase-like Zn-dependent oxidoreductase